LDHLIVQGLHGNTRTHTHIQLQGSYRDYTYIALCVGISCIMQLCSQDTTPHHTTYTTPQRVRQLLKHGSQFRCTALSQHTRVVSL